MRFVHGWRVSRRLVARDVSTSTGALFVGVSMEMSESVL